MSTLRRQNPPIYAEIVHQKSTINLLPQLAAATAV